MCLGVAQSTLSIVSVTDALPRCTDKEGGGLFKQLVGKTKISSIQDNTSN